MRNVLKYLGILLAAVLVFAAARKLDSIPRYIAAQTASVRQEADTREQTLPVPEETEPAATETEPAQTEMPTEPAEERFLLTMVGDCTLGSRDSHSYIDLGFKKTVGEDYSYPFRNVIGYFENDELTLINLEGALCDKGNAVPKTHNFRGSTDYINILTQNSVEAVSLANNHTLDYGPKGYESTVATLESAGIPYVERDKGTVITTKNGLKVGIFGAVYYRMDTDEITEGIRQLREQADLVIFAPHWGVEMNTEHNKTQEALAHAVIDAGADIVWGSHPHVLQEIEEYNGKKIFYSLANFSFGGNIYPDDYDSALIQQEIIRAADGTVSLGETIVVPVRVSSDPERNNYQPTPYEEGSEGYVRVMEKLDLTEKN